MNGKDRRNGENSGNERESRPVFPAAILLLAAVLALAAIGCSTTNSDGSPAWTTHPPSHWRTHYAVGYGKLSNVQNSRMRAEAMAMDSIARWADTTVRGALTNYFRDSGGADGQTLEMMESISTQVVDISLRGASVEEQWVAPDGGVWVLVSYPVKNLKDAYRLQAEALERSEKNIQVDVLLDYLDIELEKEGT